MPRTIVRSDPSSLPEGWDPECESVLLDLARRAIQTTLEGRPGASPDLSALPECLLARRASFVTLHENGELRGCIGSLEARSSLAEGVWHNARQAAFADPRFPPVTRDELEQLEIHISVLSPLEPLPVSSEEELLARLRPGVDGVVLAEGARRGTFLPAVWDSLPEPRDFLTELERKADLPPEHWSPGTLVWRYTAYSIPS